MRCRKSVADLTPQEKAAYVQAVLDLKDPAKSPSKIAAAATAVTNGGGTPNRYDDFVYLHNVVGTGAHRGSAFGPWHREFLRQFEADLQLVSGDPEMTIPYWDWTTARTAASPGWPFTNDFMGGFGNAVTGLISTGPFANPATWRMNIRRSGDADLTLKRSRGVPAGDDLPVIDDVLLALGVGQAPGTWPSAYDASPFNGSPPSTNPAFANQVLAAFRKYLEFLLHDGIHVWIGDVWDFVGGIPQNGGHMSFPPVAVNDPVFFLHHCNVDRLWAIWQRKTPTPAYVPAAGASAGHNAGDVMGQFTNPASFTAPLLQHPSDLQSHQAIGPWYHTDPPEVALTTNSVDFGDVPDGLTTFRPVQFSVRTCQPVTFTITQVGGPNFSMPPGQGPVVIDHAHGADVQTASVYVAYHAAGALGAPQAGSVTIEASFVDRDGYDSAAPGTVRVLGPFTANLLATPVARPAAAIGMVLDRSGSMGESAGAAGTKYDLLKSSLQVVADVMRDSDGVGLVSFDHAVAVLGDVEAMGPPTTPPTPGSGRDDVANAIAGPDLVPRGLTGIGQGMITGAGVLDAERLAAGTPYARFAMLVMTDGNENFGPSVTDPSVTSAVAPYAADLYAIGLGEPGNVSDTTLGAIANYMLVTGDMTIAERRFRLTKYFIQILAGVTGTAIAVDPQGELHVGTEHRIPFQVGESDVEVDVIALCPLAPLLEFELEAPDGTRIDPGFGAASLVYRQNREDAFYRLSLPVDPAIRGEGQWHAILRLTKDSLARGREVEGFQQIAEQLRGRGALPYSLIVQTYSNLALTVYVRPTVVLAGDRVDLYATLTEYGQPLAGRADVSVELTDPSGTTTSVTLAPSGAGSFGGAFDTKLPGLYVCRFLAKGRTLGGQPFEREETRSVSAFSGQIPPGRGDERDDQRGQRPGRQARADVAPLADEMGDDMGAEERRAPDDRSSTAGARGDEAAKPGGAEDEHGFLAAHEPHPAEEPDVAAAAAPHAGHDDMDHEHMVFEMFRLDHDAGEVRKVAADEIARDTSGFDDEGNDPGTERPVSPPRGGAGEGHGTGEGHGH